MGGAIAHEARNSLSMSSTRCRDTRLLVGDPVTGYQSVRVRSVGSDLHHYRHNRHTLSRTTLPSPRVRVRMRSAWADRLVVDL